MQIDRDLSITLFTRNIPVLTATNMVTLRSFGVIPDEINLVRMCIR
jgi:hypothetical protein